MIPSLQIDVAVEVQGEKYGDIFSNKPGRVKVMSDPVNCKSLNCPSTHLVKLKT